MSFEFTDALTTGNFDNSLNEKEPKGPPYINQDALVEGMKLGMR
jgi:hypothetical protein